MVRRELHRGRDLTDPHADAVMSTHPGSTDRPIYLDHNATTPIDPRTTAAAMPFLAAEFGNPSSAHGYAIRPTQALRAAREHVGALIGSDPDAIVFTGSGSEADNLAIRGAVLAADQRGPHVITQRTEHPAVLASCRALERLHGVAVTYLPVDGHGLVDPDALAAAITPNTVLVSIMLANNETGTIQPVTEFARVAHAHGVLMHTDAAQAVGKIAVDVGELGVDLLTLVGHKMYAPKGVAALHVRPGLRLEPIVYGGGQEHGLRSGTENVALAVALGEAAKVARAELATGYPVRQAALRDRLHHALADALSDAVALNGHPVERLPNTLNISTAGVSGNDLLAAVPDLAASTGSACHAGDAEPSPVLTAMGLARERTLGAVRLSVGRWTTDDVVDRAADLLITAARQLRPPRRDARGVS
jgi:cysteine desulfurase